MCGIDTAFRQQRLKAWQPILTPKTVLPLFFAVGVIFAPIGGLLLYASSQVQEIIIDYSTCNTTAPACQSGTTTPPQEGAFVPSGKVTSYFKNPTNTSEAPTWCKTTTDQAMTFGGPRTIPATTICHIQFQIPDDLKPPVLLYYQLTNFYQNHRRYVKSFDQGQLAGDNQTGAQINSSDCDPLKGEVTADGTWKPYYPCGLIANSRFNDTIQMPVLLNVIGGSSANNVTYNMTSDGTAWASDRDLYKFPPKYLLGEAVPPPNWRVVFPTYNESYPFPDLHTDDAFQVWMRTAGLPTFSKLALRNDNETMAHGRYQMDIYDCKPRLGEIPMTGFTANATFLPDFPVTIYDGTKSILISTRTVMGGKNPFLGIAYVVVGGLCIVLGALFTVTQLIKPR